MKWQHYPNLAARLARPSFNNGPVQRSARRALLVLGEASTSEVSRWAHRVPTRDRTRYTRRVLLRIAVRVGRAPTRGRPWLWRLRNSHGD
jgi:hypothetical protein